MQKVVGSNPISRSSRNVAEPKRKGPKDKSAGGGRGVLRRRGRHQGPDEAEARAGRKPDAKGNGSQGDRKEISPTMDSTTQASEEVKRLLEAAGDASKQIREAARTNSGAGDSPVEGNEPAALISKINSEVRTVLEAADEAGEKIREEARADGRRLVEENRRRAESVTGEHILKVTETTERVLAQLATIENQVETLRRAFDQSIKRLGVDLSAESSDVWSTKRNRVEEEEGDNDELRSRLGRRATPKAAEPEGISEGARLLALQQLNAGVDADVIAKRLTEEFGVKDPKPILQWMGVQTGKPAPAGKPKKR